MKTGIPSLFIFYTLLIAFTISAVVRFFDKKEKGHFGEKGYTGWVLRQLLLLVLFVVVWIIAINKEKG